MPNWIVNVLEIHGNTSKTSREAVVSFLKQHLHVRDYDAPEVQIIFDFNTVIPAPDRELEYVPLKERLGLGHSPQPDINWRRRNWGTKWNSSGNQYFDYEKILNGETGISGTIRLVFRTAWHPPLPVLKKVILMHPELDITCDYYSSESEVCGFIGRDPFDNDRIYHEHYKLTRDDFKQETL